MKYFYDKRALDRMFQAEELILLWNARPEDKGKHGKFDPIWLGPYLIHDNKVEDSYFIRELSSDILEFLVHGQFLKKYFC